MEILQDGHPVLRKKAKAVPLNEISSKAIQDTIQHMKSALHATKHGVAIAAPQIGVSLRLFVVKGEVFLRTSRENIAQMDPKDIPEDRVFINPVITKKSKKTTWLDEGCLSVDGYYGKIERAEKATVRAYNEQGEEFEYGASGLLSEIFQHETEHLDGILFIDNAVDVEKIEGVGENA